MADNSDRTPGTGEKVASDEVTYSGDTAKVQLVRLVQAITGSEGAKTIVDAAALADDTANPTSIIWGSCSLWYDGSTWDRARGTAADGLLVNLGANNDVTIAGDIAHDAADSGSPVKVGAKAIAHGTNPTAVAAADRTDLHANRAGIPFVVGGHPNVITYGHSAITTAVTDSALVTVSAGTKIVVTRISVTLDTASTVYPSVRIGFGTANVPALGNAGILAAHGGIPAGGGFTIGDGSGILAVGGDDQDLRITTVGNATGNGIQVTVSYYTIES